MGGSGCSQANRALKTDVISKKFENLLIELETLYNVANMHTELKIL